MADATDETGQDVARSGIDRRSLIKRAAATGAVVWTAPVLIDSLVSPAAAAGSSCSTISFVNAGAISAKDNTSTSNSTVTVTPAIPAGNQFDLIILVCGNKSNNATASAVTASGYTAVPGGQVRTTTAAVDPDFQLTLLYKIAGASEATPTVSFTNIDVATGGGSNINGSAGAVAIRYRCVSNTAPFDPATCVNGTATASTTATPTGITTLKNNSWAFSAVMTSDNNAPLTLSTPRSFTLRVSQEWDGSGSRPDFTLGFADRGPISPAGAVLMPTWSQGANQGDAWNFVSGGLHLASVP